MIANQTQGSCISALCLQ